MISRTVLIACLVAVVVWYVLCGLGRWFPWASGLVERWSPRTRWLHAWVLSAPATFTYVAIFTGSTLVQRTAPPKLIELLTTLQSTNLRNLARAPLEVLLDSMWWVADRGAGLVLYILLYVTVVAWGERRYGTPRMLVIGLSGHVFGSLLTAAVETRALRTGRAPAELAITTDVGVSYVMVAGCAAAVLLMRGRWLVAGVVSLVVGIVAPAVVMHTIWNLGHLFATSCGLLAAWALLRVAPARRPPDLLRCLPPRTPPVPRSTRVGAEAEAG
ncbi:rhomboid-like protein [Spirillospora sp. NPDC047279]|uniref:rhomboid-like protein n=1 Tax=Spirillospora sp. NPDC047279 TaxID=3155478 RepID=UPI00340982EF